MSKKAVGICALTGSNGAFVKCHILPKSLCPREQAGGRLIESDGFGFPKMKYDSWYDPKLEIRRGEDILEKIDNTAINELRRAKLIWRAWENASALDLKENDSQGVFAGYRDIDNLDQQALGRFVVSVLGRAGSSRIPAMQDFKVSADTLEHARQISLRQASFDAADFPVRVFQYATKGPIHNLAPMTHELVFPNGRREPFFRIFANGVFFHVVDVRNAQGFSLGRERWFLGNSDSLAVVGLRFEGSAQGDLVDHIFSHYVTSIQ